jgi:acetolactate synthase small subunit
MSMATIPILQDDNLETVYLIWLDASINKSKENLHVQQELRSIINHLKTFENVPDCEQYIHQTSTDDRICLIVNGQLGEEIVPRIHQYRQIFSIYVYCFNQKRNEEWSKHFTKVIKQKDFL